ncbi:MAG: dTDP-glucose 4,6-dehydratase, partial [Verrucomicrobiota bacterium]
MNLLVTGGAGFIGSNLISHIMDRREISRLVNLDALTYAGQAENISEFRSHPKYVFEQIDLRNYSDVLGVLRRHDITHVIHLAAESHVDRSITGPAPFVETNVLGTFHLLESCRALWPDCQKGSRHRFLHVSTDEVYGSLGPTGKSSETSPYAPNSPYAASKASSDFFVRAWARTFGLPTLITNCSNNFGPRQFPEKLIPVVIQSALDRKPIPVYGDGQQVRDWLFVRDHTEALWQVLTRGRIGEAYNIGAENELPNLRLVEMLCELVDELAPHPSGSAKSLIQFVEDRPGHDRRYALDASKIRAELGWHPQHDFKSALRETVHWYVENQAWVATVLTKKSVAPAASDNAWEQR